MSYRNTLLAFALLAGGATASFGWSTPATSTHATTHHAKARISMSKARSEALASVPGKVKTANLERENGKLVYAIDISRPGHKGLTEVDVSATTGKVLSTHHESKAKALVHRAKAKMSRKSSSAY